MASFVSNRAHFRMLDEWLNPGGTLATLRVLLMASGHAEAKTANVLADVVADKATGTNIAVKTLAGVSITQNDSDGGADLDADNPQWTDANPATEIDGGWVYVQTTDTVAVGGVSTGTKTFTLTGVDLTADFFDGAVFSIAGSTGNNGTYTVASSSFTGGNTEVVVEETVSDATADGTITYDDISECDLYGFGDAVDVDPSGNTLVLVLASPMHALGYTPS